MIEIRGFLGEGRSFRVEGRRLGCRVQSGLGKQLCSSVVFLGFWAMAVVSGTGAFAGDAI
jgi:hypothetical protein